MSITSKVMSDLRPFLKYAVKENPSNIVKIWKDPDGCVKIHTIYEKCLSCNTKRFNLNELLNPTVGVNTYFCLPCENKVRKIAIKYEKHSSLLEKKIFLKIWEEKFFNFKV